MAELEPGSGYNAATGEYGDLIGAGVIDPVKVTRSALANAASIASLLLTTETLVVEKPEEEDAAGWSQPRALPLTVLRTCSEPRASLVRGGPWCFPVRTRPDFGSLTYRTKFPPTASSSPR